MVGTIVAALVSIAIPDSVEEQATVAADCLCDMACETPAPATGPDDGRNGTMTAPRRIPVVATVAVLGVGLLASCTRSPSSDPTGSPVGDETTVAEFEELSGFDLPGAATDVVVEPVPGSSVGALRARFTVPEAELDRFCGTPLPMSTPFTDQERTTFALPGELTEDEARDCESMRTGTNVSRRVIIAPADADQVRLHVVAFEMPR